MRKIWHYLTEHVKQDFHAKAYATITLFLAISITFNYRFDFEDTFLDTLPDLPRLLAYFGWHVFAYFIPVLILFTAGRHRALQHAGFYKIILPALFLLSLDRSLPFVNILITSSANPMIQYWLIKIAHNVSGIIILILPLLIGYTLTHSDKDKHYYGLIPRQFDAGPYFVMLLIMLPLLLFASTLPGFQAQYPMYEKTAAASYWHLPEWLMALLYELAYGLNFVGVEFFYRGFLILALVPYLGRSSVLTMAVLYCFLHFGKPMPEAISSVFGGYILGVIAMETRSIWGGIIVHVGIAWMMELLGYIF
ncbi:MAG: CPBP family intramembrane metalloprotease [Cyclobacteriaceae bacterium]|nr:CPBP family intramembrane metalloprotease [Cyclobacteriaceae bacterium]MCX7638490.1 CPBP family intramembrane metalloprotease [Cyclobacteriaceae bacterium]MDW8330895.1 CPBP family intramembrane glutamic endopeptidase [Cyclobacteriaceae bacterium]